MISKIREFIEKQKKDFGLNRKYLTLDQVRRFGSMQTYPVRYRYSIITVIVVMLLATSLLPGPNIPGLWLAKKLWRFV